MLLLVLVLIPLSTSVQTYISAVVAHQTQWETKPPESLPVAALVFGRLLPLNVKVLYRA